MSLYDQLITLSPNNYKYYYNAPNMDFLTFNHKNAYNFIRGTYRTGSKDKIFDVGFINSFESNGKHQHTVILYFLGCIFESLFSADLKTHLAKFILNVEDWFDFRYTWFLTSLYHDTASILEKEKSGPECSADLNFYLEKYEVNYNLYDNNYTRLNPIPHTYSEKLVKNYFKYRMKSSKIVDHGIIAGFVLYDRLIKNYDRAWKKHSEANLPGSYDDFIYNGLSWRKDHKKHFAIIADAIIAHNIWYSKDNDDEKAIYKNYELDELIFNKSKRISIQKNPLVLFLGLFDTIEPFKYFETNDCFAEIDIHSISKDILRICVNDNKKNFTWLKKIESMAGWLSVEIDRSSSNTIDIRIVR